MKGYSFRSLTDLVLKIFKTEINAGTGLSGGGSLEADRTLSVKYGTDAGTATQGNDSRLSDSREWTAATISQAETEAGIAATRRAFTAQRVRQAIVAWWNSITGVFGRDLVTSASNTVARDKLGLFTSALRWPSWAEVSGKPTTFPSSSHTHPWSQVTDKPTTALRWPSWAEVTGKPTIPNPWPVGIIYTQYPNTPTPQSLLGGTWKLLFNNESAFFRTEGVESNTFESGIQQDAIKSHGHLADSASSGGHAHSGTTDTSGNHTHSGSTSSAGAHTHTSYGYQIIRSGGNIGWMDGNNSNYNGAATTSSAGAHTHSISTTISGNHTHSVITNTVEDHSHIITVRNTGTTETRPKNHTIRVWQRTA